MCPFKECYKANLTFTSPQPITFHYILWSIQQYHDDVRWYLSIADTDSGVVTSDMTIREGNAGYQFFLRTWRSRNSKWWWIIATIIHLWWIIATIIHLWWIMSTIIHLCPAANNFVYSSSIRNDIHQSAVSSPRRRHITQCSLITISNENVVKWWW
jgi:hypothetical protein